MSWLLRTFVASVATMSWNIPAHAASPEPSANDALSANANWSLIYTAACASKGWIASAAPGGAGSMVPGLDANSAMYFMMPGFNESGEWYGEEIPQAEPSDTLSPNATTFTNAAFSRPIHITALEAS